MVRSIVPRYFLLALSLIGCAVSGVAPAHAQTIGDFSGLWTRGARISVLF